MTLAAITQEAGLAAVLRDCHRRGKRAPVLAVSDGAPGFWAALREVSPKTREQRGWIRKTDNAPVPAGATFHNGRLIERIDMAA